MAKVNKDQGPPVLNKRAGEIRLSQAIFTYGVGAIVDLPTVSVMVSGLDEWDADHYRMPCFDARLLRAVRATERFKKVTSLESAPITGKEFEKEVGVPVSFFPRWLHCSQCHRIASVDSGQFELRGLGKGWVHKAEYCTAPGNWTPSARPVRFIAGCKEHGHMQDFPWNDYVHNGNPCQASLEGDTLRLREYGASGEAKDIRVYCDACKNPQSGKNTSMPMSVAFEKSVGYCDGRHPHLGISTDCRTDKGRVELKTMLESATNTWFPVTLSALTIPEGGVGRNALRQLVEELWSGSLSSVESEAEFSKFFMKHNPDNHRFKTYDPADVWEVIEEVRESLETEEEDSEAASEMLRQEEWAVLTDEEVTNPKGYDYAAEHVEAPQEFTNEIESVVRLLKLREVRALLGFKRIQPPGDSFEHLSIEEIQPVPLAKEDPTWLPASEARGEGIFIRFSEEALVKWESTATKTSLYKAFESAHKGFAKSRGIGTSSPKPRYIMLHSFAHALIRQISLDCGYATASIRERIYADDGMAGVLLYTSASDSEGTLGGLVSLGRPEKLGTIISRMLEELQTCSSDPLCSENEPTAENEVLHGAACHTCLFISETSCERGNRYLDRSTLVRTIADEGVGFPLPFFGSP